MRIGLWLAALFWAASAWAQGVALHPDLPSASQPVPSNHVASRSRQSTPATCAHDASSWQCPPSARCAEADRTIDGPIAISDGERDHPTRGGARGLDEAGDDVAHERADPRPRHPGRPSYHGHRP